MPFTNRIRLPFYLSRPQFPVDEEVYLKSNGRRVVLRSQVSKEYEGKTDWLPSEIHERLVIALRHDSVNIEGDKINIGARINGSYDIGWVDFLNYPLAIATFKCLEEAFAARSTLCNICTPVAGTSTVADDYIPGQLEADTEYIYDVSANDSICCDSPEYKIVSWDATYIVSASINANGLVTFLTTGDFEPAANVPFIEYEVICNGVSYFATVYGTFGNVSGLCEPPSELQVVIVVGDLSQAEAVWVEPAPPPANGYALYLYRVYNGNQVLIYSNGVATNSAPLPTLLPNTTYFIKVKSQCTDGSSSQFVTLQFTTPPDGTGGRITGGAVQIALVKEGNDFKISFSVVSPSGETFNDPLVISGNINVMNEGVVPFSITVPANQATYLSAAIHTSTETIASISSASVSPVYSVATDTNSYNIAIMY